MKRLALLSLLLATPAFAQAPTADQVRDEANGIIAALRQQRDANADQLAQAMAANAKLAKELDATKKAAPAAASAPKDAKK